MFTKNQLSTHFDTLNKLVTSLDSKVTLTTKDIGEIKQIAKLICDLIFSPESQKASKSEFETNKWKERKVTRESAKDNLIEIVRLAKKMYDDISITPQSKEELKILLGLVEKNPIPNPLDEHCQGYISSFQHIVLAMKTQLVNIEKGNSAFANDYLPELNRLYDELYHKIYVEYGLDNEHEYVVGLLKRNQSPEKLLSLMKAFYTAGEAMSIYEYVSLQSSTSMSNDDENEHEELKKLSAYFNKLYLQSIDALNQLSENSKLKADVQASSEFQNAGAAETTKLLEIKINEAIHPTPLSTLVINYFYSIVLDIYFSFQQADPEFHHSTAIKDQLKIQDDMLIQVQNIYNGFRDEKMAPSFKQNSQMINYLLLYEFFAMNKLLITIIAQPPETKAKLIVTVLNQPLINGKTPLSIIEETKEGKQFLSKFTKLTNLKYKQPIQAKESKTIIIANDSPILSPTTTTQPSRTNANNNTEPTSTAIGNTYPQKNK